MLPGMDKDLGMILSQFPGNGSALDKLGSCPDNSDDLHGNYLLVYDIFVEEKSDFLIFNYRLCPMHRGFSKGKRFGVFFFTHREFKTRVLGMYCKGSKTGCGFLLLPE